MTDSNEPTWWRGFHAGDLNAFAQLIETHQHDIFAVALATVVDRGLAEDVAQETFIAAFTHRDRLRDPASVGGWLAAIARNLGRDLLRARKRERLVEMPELEIAASEADSPSRQLDHASLCRHVRRALEKVPSRYREVLILYYAYERSVDSIADSLGLTVAATMQRLSRGRRLVRDHGMELHEFVTPSRRKRSFAVAVLALLSLRSRAQAAPVRSSVAPRALVGWLAGLVIVLGLVGAEEASGGDPGAARMRTPTLARSVLASPPAPSELAAPAPAARASSSPPQRRVQTVRSAPRLIMHPPVRTPVVAIADTIAVEEPAASPPGLAPIIVSVAPPIPAAARRESWDQVNGFLETAALPRPGDISYEMVGLVMMVRAGVTRHLAAHVGVTAMDTNQGTGHANANPAFGGGLKVGTRISPGASVAVLAEGGREVNLKTMSTRDGWMGRIVASVTLGTPRLNTTLIAGAVSTFDGNQRWHSPILGITSQLGWDERLLFILEEQRFMSPNGTLKGTSVLAVRFRNAEMPSNFLGVDRMRLDVGALLLERTNGDYDGLPWVQVGLGW